jgi:hypothetical protein
VIALQHVMNPRKDIESRSTKASLVGIGVFFLSVLVFMYSWFLPLKNGHCCQVVNTFIVTI